jgi:LmbE family N-acetylglucosaminyl deacetylase/tetratricopeptide (TPR) repeat protein
MRYLSQSAIAVVLWLAPLCAEYAVALGVESSPVSHADARHDDMHRELAERYIKGGALVEAIREYEAALKASPNDIDSRWHLAEALAWSGDYDRALVTYEDVLRASPSNVEARIGMADVLRWSHRYSDSEQQLETVLRADPDNLEALKSLAQTYALAGDFTRSLGFLNRGIDTHPHDAELLAQKGTVLSWSGDLAGGIDLLKSAVALNPTASGYRSLADAYVWRKEFSSAAESYRRAWKLEPKSIETALDLARAYQKAGERTLAEEAVTQALRIAPNDHQAIELLQEIRRDGRMDTQKAIDVIGEPVAFLAILSLPSVFFYKRQRRFMWQSPMHRRLYAVILPALSFLFVVIYTLHVLAESNVIFKILETGILTALSICTLLLFREMHASAQSPKVESILVIGAHPDDIELGAAGSLLKLTREGKKVYALVMTQGEIGTSAPAGVREGEARQGANQLGLSNLWVLSYPDTHLREHISAMREVIETKIRELGIQMVITHSPHETHGDHLAVFEAAKEAARSCSLLCYESISAPKEFVPNYFVDITAFLPDKLLAISSHKTQRRKFYMDSELVKGRAAHRGLQAGVPYAEAFWVYRWVQ